jgi:hypothetical protein
MRKTILVFLMFLMAHRLMAQVGNVGINTSTPSAMLHVKDSSVLFSGATTLPGTPGNPPVSGAGIRMMWYPDKAAFRAGRVSSTQWDKDSIGNYSFATGYNAKAKGQYSVALGNSTIATGNFSAAIGSAAIASGEIAAAIGESVTASGQSSMALGANSVASGLGSAAIGSGASATNSFSIALGGSTASGNRSVALGDNTLSSGSGSTAMGSFTAATGNFSTAMGEGTTASGNRSTAMGEGTIASGSRSTAIGFFTTATGNHSTAMGLYTTSRPYASFVVGRYNDSIITSSMDTWVETDPVFIIGNGTADNARKNALVVLKNARTGINTSTPAAMLHVEGNAKLGIKGTVIDELIKVTRIKNVPNVAANSTITETFVVSDALPGSTVYISPADALDDGLLIAYARVSVAGTVEVKFTNTTGLAINPVAMDFYITVIR